MAITPIARKRLHQDVINSIRFSDYESYVVTAGQDGRAAVWNWRSGDAQQFRTLSTAVFSAEFSPGTRHTVLTGSKDGHAKLWDVTAADTPRADWAWHKIDVREASFDFSGNWVVTASSDGTAVIWDRKHESEPYTLLGHHGALTGASFSPDGRLVATASADHTARIWLSKNEAELLASRK